MHFDIDIRKTLRSGKRTFTLAVRFQSDSQRVVIYGPSGAGKSLTLGAIAGLVRPDAGRIAVDGTVLFDSSLGIDLRPQARRVGYLFQDYALFPHLNVRQNVAFGQASGWFNPRAGVQDEAVDYWLRAFDLLQVAHQLPSELSGGQRQRVALARAVVTRPAALLLDEPFAALDADLRAGLRAELDRFQRELGIPMILITHDPADVAVFGERVVQLRDGVSMLEEDFDTQARDGVQWRQRKPGSAALPL